jgi:hypothetical protein
MRGALSFVFVATRHFMTAFTEYFILFLCVFATIYSGHVVDEQQNVKSTEANAQAAVARIVAGRDELKSQIQVRELLSRSWRSLDIALATHD